MKNPYSRLRSFFHSLSLRFQIIVSLASGFILALVIVIFMANIVLFILGTNSSLYQSNADLNEYLSLINDTENSLESYMRNRTFESINKFYQNQNDSEIASCKFCDYPSTSQIKHNEYIIRQLSSSFFDLSNKAVAARRANNAPLADLYYSKTLACYDILRGKIIDLNMTFFTLNAKNYNVNKSFSSAMIKKTVLFIFIILISAVILIFISVSHTVKPLSDISEVALRLADNDFDIPLFNNKRKNEIGNICRAFDSMVISIKEYIRTIIEKAAKENELREKEIEVKALYTEAQLKALQNQVKPHFLFNTLNTGAQLAMIEGADKTCFFLEKVADFLRYNIQHPENEVTISQELGMLDSYIYIMKVRFGERYRFVRNIDESVLNVRMPGMILQPLVENCIKHGLGDVEENGIITINVLGKDGFIEISITDNGCGFNEEVKKQIMEQVEVTGAKSEQTLNETGHVSLGLVNVISRLRIYFKDKDVFNIMQNPSGRGTMFYIKIKNV